MPVSKIAYKDKEIVVVDCSNCSTDAKDKIIATLQEGNRVVAACGNGKAYVITNVTNLAFNGDVSDAFKEYASKNTPYVKKSALVGLSGLQKIAFTAIKTFTKREYFLAETMEDAKNYMTV